MPPRPPSSTLFPYTTLFRSNGRAAPTRAARTRACRRARRRRTAVGAAVASRDRKSTRLNSSHLGISYAVFCLKKKKNNTIHTERNKQKEQETEDKNNTQRST